MMKKTLLYILLVCYCQTAVAIITIQTKTPSGTLLVSSSYLSNCVEVKSTDDLDAVYAAIKAKVPTSANRWVIRYYPGTYTRTSAYIWDADFIDHEGIGPSPDDVIITRGTGGPTVTQTASDIRCSNFTIRNTGNAAGDHGFLINAAANNNASVYEKMQFRQPNVYGYSRYPVYAASDLGGTWRNCAADNYAWRCAVNKNLTATMYDCQAGKFSYGGDNENDVNGTGVISGNLYDCTGGDGSFGGCGFFGCSITGYIEGCTGGANSFSLGSTISGTVIRCRGGMNSFAGHITNTHPGKITGTVKECVAAGGHSFAMGYSGCIQSGHIINCDLDPLSKRMGYTLAGPSTVMDLSTYASASTNIAGANNDLLFTSRIKGTLGHNLTVIYSYLIFSGNPYLAISYSGSSIIFTLKLQSNNTTTAAALKGLIESNSVANTYLAVTYADGDGSGTIPNGSPSPGTLTGGINSPVFSNNCPLSPVMCQSDTTVYPFDNGAIYTNTGVGGKTITITLPSALDGYSYSFWDSEDTPGGDLIIAADSSDIIVGDADNQLVADDDSTQFIKLRCLVSGKWQVEASSGKWD
jgi:hypothetical protein